MRFLSFVGVVVATLSWSQGVQAQGLLEVISDEKRLAGTVRDIAAMGGKELDLFTDALTACLPLAKGGLIRANCREKTDRFLIEFERGRDIESLWLSLVVAIEMDWKYREKDHVFVIERAYAIERRLTEAVRQAYRSSRKN